MRTVLLRVAETVSVWLISSLPSPRLICGTRYFDFTARGADDGGVAVEESGGAAGEDEVEELAVDVGEDAGGSAGAKADGASASARAKAVESRRTREDEAKEEAIIGTTHGRAARRTIMAIVDWAMEAMVMCDGCDVGQWRLKSRVWDCPKEETGIWSLTLHFRPQDKVT